MNLWPGEPPGPKATTNAEVNTTTPSDHLTGGKTVIRLGNITVPTFTLYPAPARTNTGAAVV
ncbi:MAG: alpha/beta hydrolase, partial [Bryobacteraceae bacterium]